MNVPDVDPVTLNVLDEIANDPALQPLMRSALQAREAVVKKVAAVAKAKGLSVTVKSNTDVANDFLYRMTGATARASASDQMGTLHNWLQSNNITWSRLAFDGQ